MKNLKIIFSMLFLATLTLTSCKKEKIEPPVPKSGNSGIEGNWSSRTVTFYQGNILSDTPGPQYEVTSDRFISTGNGASSDTQPYVITGNTIKIAFPGNNNDLWTIETNTSNSFIFSQVNSSNVISKIKLSR